jgi:lysophospholipase L1-like esterase
MKKRTLYILIIPLFLFTNCRKESPEQVVTDTKEAVSYLALGDSYTIGESVDPSQRFPVLLAKELEVAGIPVEDPTIIARTGWTTADLQKGITKADLKESGYDLVSLLIGVNNQYQGRSLEEYKEEFTTLLLRAINLAGDSKEKVFVVSIPDYGYTPFGQSNQEAISADIDRFNAVNKQVSDSIGVLYFNITPISRNGLSDPALVADDGLHPSGKMYGQWVALMLDEVKKLVASL